MALSSYDFLFFAPFARCWLLGPPDVGNALNFYFTADCRLGRWPRRWADLGENCKICFSLNWLPGSVTVFLYFIFFPVCVQWKESLSLADFDQPWAWEWPFLAPHIVQLCKQCSSCSNVYKNLGKIWTEWLHKLFHCLLLAWLCLCHRWTIHLHLF